MIAILEFERQVHRSRFRCAFSLALKISQVFVPQVWSITLLLLERISPHSAAKIRIIFEMTMKKCKKIVFLQVGKYKP
jgi:hypothetical protein